MRAVVEKEGNCRQTVTGEKRGWKKVRFARVYGAEGGNLTRNILSKSCVFARLFWLNDPETRRPNVAPEARRLREVSVFF